MATLRRVLGVFVMAAGVIGLLLSIAGLVGLFAVRPGLTASLSSTIDTLSTSVETSQKTLVIANEALGATITSVDALADMLGATSVTVNDTQPVITQVNEVMGETLPTAIKAATDSLMAAEGAAQSMEVAIKTFESLQTILKSVPMVGYLLPASQEAYNPNKPLAESLGDLSASIQGMPATFKGISTDMEKADDNLELVKSNLDIMSKNVALIGTSLKQYQAMIGESRTSMDNILSILTGVQNNLGKILNTATAVFGLFLLWLLATQVVIFSQGWELYHGTASRMETAAKVEVREAGHDN